MPLLRLGRAARAEGHQGARPQPGRALPDGPRAGRGGHAPVARPGVLSPQRSFATGGRGRDAPGLRALLGLPGPDPHLLDGRHQPHAAGRPGRLVSRGRRAPGQLRGPVDRRERGAFAQGDPGDLPVRSGGRRRAGGGRPGERHGRAVLGAAQVRPAAGPGQPRRDRGPDLCRTLRARALAQRTRQRADRVDVERAGAPARVDHGLPLRRPGVPVSVERPERARHGRGPGVVDEDPGARGGAAPAGAASASCCGRVLRGRGAGAWATSAGLYPLWGTGRCPGDARPSGPGRVQLPRCPGGGFLLYCRRREQPFSSTDRT